MKLILNSAEWLELKAGLPKSFNIPNQTVRGIPAQFPVLVHYSPVSDANGWAVECNFVYEADARRLIEACEKAK